MKSFTAFLIVLYLNFGCLQATFEEGVKPKKPWTELRIRYDPSALSGFEELPRHKSGRHFEGFIEVEPEDGFRIPVDFFCQKNDPKVCLMFDKSEQLAGIQISYLQSEFENIATSDFDFTNNPSFVLTNFFNMPAYSFRIFFTNPRTLTHEGSSTREGLAEGVWAYLDGQLYQVPTDQPQGDNFGDFYKQGCVDKMGSHFFYKLRKSFIDCDTLTPFFVTYENEKLVGFGMSVFGSGLNTDRIWYEPFTKEGTEFMIPDRPQCFDELYYRYKLTTTHVYLVTDPHLIKCH